MSKANPATAAAIALGHPSAAAPAPSPPPRRCTSSHSERGRYAPATMCIGGGQGIAAVFERLEQALAHARSRRKTCNLRISAAEAVRQVRDGDLIIVPTGVGEPPALLTALSEQRRDFKDVKVSQILAMRKYAYIDPETTQHVRHVALFFGGATRAGGTGRLDRLHPQLLLRDPGADRARPDPGRRGVQHGLADGRPRLLRAQPGRRLHDGGGGPGPCRGARGEPQRAVRQRQLPRACLAGRGPGGEQRPGARGRAAGRSARCSRPSASMSPT